jgi:hypothetical protein
MLLKIGASNANWNFQQGFYFQWGNDVNFYLNSGFVNDEATHLTIVGSTMDFSGTTFAQSRGFVSTLTQASSYQTGDCSSM